MGCVVSTEQETKKKPCEIISFTESVTRLQLVKVGERLIDLMEGKQTFSIKPTEK